ncbi:MAG: potassium channel family protein [Polyangiales bacterium]
MATRAGSAYGVEALFNLVLVAGAYSSASRGGQRWPFVGLTALTLVTRWSALLQGGFGLEVASALTTVVWITLAIVIVVRELFRQREVSVNAILGAMVAYLLAAVAFAYLYEILEIFQPGSFSGLPVGANPQELGDALLYFSLVSLTTVGYGDIAPTSSLARPVAVFEGVFGTLYLAVMIARLVGLNIASGMQREGNEP